MGTTKTETLWVKIEGRQTWHIMGTTKTETLWVKIEGRQTWHIATLRGRTTLCGLSVTGDEESERYLPWSTLTCPRCHRAKDAA